MKHRIDSANRFGILSTFLFALLTSSISSAQEKSNLFNEVSVVPRGLIQAEFIHETVVRSRVVTTNADSFPTAARTPGFVMPMNFFAGSEVNVVLANIAYRGDNDYTWTGFVEGEGDGGSATIVVKDGVMVANVRSEQQGYFQVRLAEAGVMEIREIDETLFAGCDTDEEDMVDAPPLRDTRIQFAPRDTSAYFDVMVVYTPAARTAAGGTTAMEALITLAVSETNTAYTESLINSQARLVHQEEISYTEVDSATDLTRVRGTADGFMDTVHTLRNTYGADLVSLFTDYSGSTCGRASLMTTLSAGFDVSAFSVVSYNCATGYYSFAHEMAHNMGSHHAIPETSQGAGLYNYSMGWRWNSDAQRSIMAYSPGTRVGRFSNPDVLYNGFATGQTLGETNEASNALSINNAASTVANWRTSITPAAVSPETDIDSIGIQGGTFTPSSDTYTILNTSDSSLDWTASKTQSWVTLSSSGGTLATGISADILVSINSGADSLATGDYNDTVTFTDTTNGIDFIRSVNLSVTSRTLRTTTYDSADIPQSFVNGITSTLDIADSETITDVDVTLNISHSYDDDVEVWLESPTGTMVELFSHVGSSGNNFTDTTFDDEAATLITAGSAPFSSSYRPEGTLASFDDENCLGTWTLHVTDNFSGSDNGTLNTWSVTIEYDDPGPTDVVYVDLNNSAFENGAVGSPWNTLAEALLVLDANGTINLVGDSGVTSSTETFTGGDVIDQDANIDSVNGTVTLGVSP